MDHDEPKQLKLTNRVEGEVKEKKEKKEKDPKGNKWVILTVLVISVIISLVFYLSGKRPVKINTNQDNPLGGQKVYQF